MDRRSAAGVPTGMPDIEIDGVRLAVAREGVGPALVCLHAVGHGGGDFAALAERLRDRFDVIRIDWPGQGRSGPDHQPASPERYAALLDGVLTRIGAVRPVIIGNSIGGAATILYASRHPVAALVLCDTGGLVPVTTTVRRFCAAFAAFFAAGERGSWWFKPAFALYYRLVLRGRAATQQRRRIVASAYEIAPLLRQAWAGFGRPQADIRALAAALDIPIWIAWAKQDRVIPLARCRAAIKTLRQATVTTFSGGHAAFLEQPARFVEGFDRFLATAGLS